jgi:hypothetical protein
MARGGNKRNGGRNATVKAPAGSVSAASKRPVIIVRQRSDSKPITKKTVRILKENDAFGDVIELAEEYADKA